MSASKNVHGRGAADNPSNRFERIAYVPDPESAGDDPAPGTVFLRDTSRSIVARNDSPDIAFDASVNPYRGCEHGCIYCYARPTHEHLGFSAGLDFETRILVKQDAPALLRRELSSSRWQPGVVALSGVTDPYQPIERRLRITRGVLEVLRDFRKPVTVVTKNHLVTRDVDLLGELALHHAAVVNISVTTLDAGLQRIMEPRTSIPARRLAAIRTLTDAGIPVRVLVAPVIPGLNDHEIPAILEAAAQSGARAAGWVLLRLPHGVAALFSDWLERHFPDRRQKVLGRIRETRDGLLNIATFGERMRGRGELAEQIGRLFTVARRRAGIPDDIPPLSTGAFRQQDARGQLGLFESARARPLRPPASGPHGVGRVAGRHQ